jgi:hypothetical protein
MLSVAPTGLAVFSVVCQDGEAAVGEGVGAGCLHDQDGLAAVVLRPVELFHEALDGDGRGAEGAAHHPDSGALLQDRHTGHKAGTALGWSLSAATRVEGCAYRLLR